MRRSILPIMYIVAMLGLGLVAPIAMADPDNQANATVSFDAWQTGPALAPPPVEELDRSPINSPAGRNDHQLLPQEVKIKAGGAVNFRYARWADPDQ